MGTAGIQCPHCETVVIARVDPSGYDDIKAVLSFRVHHLTPRRHHLYSNQSVCGVRPGGYTTDYSWDPNRDPVLVPDDEWEETGERWGGDPCPWCGRELSYEEYQDDDSGPFITHPPDDEDSRCDWIPNGYPATNIGPRPS